MSLSSNRFFHCSLASILLGLASFWSRFWLTLAALLYYGRLPDRAISLCQWRASARELVTAALRRLIVFSYAALFAVVWATQVFWRNISRADSSEDSPTCAELILEVPSRPWLTHRTIKLKGVRLHYVESGRSRNKPLVLLLHDLAEFWYSWRFQLDFLRHSAWVVAVDLPGTGGSDKRRKKHIYSADFVAKLMHNFVAWLDRDCCAVVGSGIGAVVGFQMIKMAPHTVSHFVSLSQPLIDVTLHSMQSSLYHKWKLWYLYAFQIPWLPEYLLSIGHSQFVRGEYDRVMKAGNCTRTDLLAYHFTFSDCVDDWRGPITYYRHMLHFRDLPSVDCAINTPCLLIFGDQDRTSTADDRYRSLESVRQARVEVLPGGGRHLSQQLPEAVNQLIFHFLDLRIEEPEPAASATAAVTLYDPGVADDRIVAGSDWPGLGSVIYQRSLDSVKMACRLWDIYTNSVKYIK